MMKNKKTIHTARTWNKEDYFEYMDVALDAHSVKKHESVRLYAENRHTIDVIDSDHTHAHQFMLNAVETPVAKTKTHSIVPKIIR